MATVPAAPAAATRRESPSRVEAHDEGVGALINRADVADDGEFARRAELLQPGKPAGGLG